MNQQLNSLEDWLQHISLTHPSEIELGLDRVKEVRDRLCFKSPPKKIVLVAGTNGKGSTISMLEHCLISLDYKVGSYTSPHILNFNERIRIGLNDISDAELIASFEEVDEARGSIKLTYFEFATLAALVVLLNSGLDVALLEIGLGGRLDAVNIVDPDVSIITSVDFDHTDWLGETLTEIGREKAGILRERKFFISGKDLPDIVHQTADELSTKSVRSGRDFYSEDGFVSLSSLSGDKCLKVGLPRSTLPENNILISLQAVCILEYLLKNADIKRVELEKCVTTIENLNLPGRLEKVKGYPVYLDVGHNAQAARFLSEFMKLSRDDGLAVDVVYSALGDKDVDAVVRAVAPFVSEWFIASLDVPRAIDSDELFNVVSHYSSSIQNFSDIHSAIAEWLNLNVYVKNNNSDRILLVFGSFYTVEAATRYFKQ